MSWRGSECPSVRSGWRVETLTVAACQTDMNWKDKEANLDQIPGLVSMAAQQGAQVIILPEAVGGYSYSREFWRGAERSGGPTTQLLCDLAREHRVHVGGGVLEARGEHFYNVFVMAGPQGVVLGEVLKQAPAALEALYFKGGKGPKHIDLPALGIRVGVGICYDNQLNFLVDDVVEGDVDLMLMPHCAMFPEGLPQSYIDEWSEGFKNLASKVAAVMGVPVVFANHAGKWGGPILGGPFHFKAPFMGWSQVVQAGGEVVCEGGTERRVVTVGEVVIPPKGTISATMSRVGRDAGGRYVPWCGIPPLVRRIFEVDEAIFSFLYTLSWERRQAALRVSGGEGTFELPGIYACIVGAAVVGYSLAKWRR